MRLTRFYVKQHLLLRDLDLHFDRPNRLDTDAYALDFLVGVNGSGKTTVLRALTQIISDLRSGEYTNFDYELEYTLADQRFPVEIGGLKPTKVQIIRHSDAKDKPSSLKIFVDDGWAKMEITGGIELKYLPKRVVVYSSGNEAEWELLLANTMYESVRQTLPEDLKQDPVKRALIELPGSMAENVIQTPPEGEPPFWLMRASRLPVITLCGLLSHLSSENLPMKDVIDAVGVQAVVGFSLRFRLHTALSDRDAYNKLVAHATRSLRQGTDYLLYFDLPKGTEFASEILNEFGSGFELYRALDELSTENPNTGQLTLQQVSIFLQRKSASVMEENQLESDSIPGLFLFDWLSDGEQSFLGRMAMLALLDTEDSLILLDEPEVHFNDYWKRRIVQLLDSIMKGHNNQILMTTHSTIVISDVTADQVFLFTKNEQGFTEVSETVSPIFGSDPGDIMINLLGTGRAGGAYSRDVLEAAIKRGDPEELRILLSKVGHGYWQFRILDRLEGLNAASS
jgi:energy-coupling factor transporter ATP-binding protein EcfA2